MPSDPLGDVLLQPGDTVRLLNGTLVTITRFLFGYGEVWACWNAWGEEEAGTTLDRLEPCSGPVMDIDRWMGKPRPTTERDGRDPSR